MEGRHYEGGGGDHFSTSVEIERDEDADEHHNQMSEVQYIEVAANGEYEQTKLVVEGVDSGSFKLVFFHPTSLDKDPWPTVDIPADATAAQVKAAIQNWYYTVPCEGLSNHACHQIGWRYFDMHPNYLEVTLEKFDIDGNPPEASDEYPYKEETEVYKHVYTIMPKRLRNGKYMSSVMVMKNPDTQANIQYILPAEEGGRISNKPLSGAFIIDCIGTDGMVSNSWEYPAHSNINRISQWLQMSCFGLRDKIQVWEDPKFNYWGHGRAFWIRFNGKTGNMGQVKIRSGVNTPLGGD